MNFLGLGNNAVVQFKLRTKKGRPTKQVVLNSSKGLVKDLCIFQGNESIAGVIDITPKKRKLGKPSILTLNRFTFTSGG